MKYSHSFFAKLIRNRGALLGLMVIALACFMAIFGYLFTTDKSTDANRMLVEIGGKSPGFQTDLLVLPNTTNPVTTSWWQQLLHGKKENHIYLPINHYVINGDSLLVQKYVDADTSVSEVYSLSKIKTQFPHSNWSVIHYKAWLGTDKYGRDIWSRLVIGFRVSLGVGMVAVLISLSLGLILGAIAGYFRGKIDGFIMWFINVLWSVPTLLLVFAFTLLLGKGFWQVLIAIGLTMWVNVARLVRGQVLSIRELEYIQAAKVLGYSPFRIILNHVIPNIMGPVWVLAASNFASAIVIEAGLSFLGIGVQPPQSSWGLMIKENYNFIITNNPMLALVPGLAIMIMVLSFNLLGNGLRDALDVREN